MTILEHPTRNGKPQSARRRNQAGRAISQADLVKLVRELRDDAELLGERIPGRPALAATIGVKPHRVRAALEELGRERKQARATRNAPGRADNAPTNADGTRAKAPIGTSSDLAGTRDVEQGAMTPPAVLPTTQDKIVGEDVATAQINATGSPPEAGTPAGAGGFYIVAAMSLLVSMNTSWRFFENNLHIADLAERSVMFGVLEAGLIACGLGMRANVRRSGQPGAPRLFAWMLCGMSSYMACLLSGPSVGLARVALGPALGLVMLHLALGIEIKARHARTTTLARVGRELRERLLSRLGLADDERDALARTRQRAAGRVARLSLGTTVWFRTARVLRALKASNAAHDPGAQDWLLAELATTQHAKDLPTLTLPSPWKEALSRRAAIVRVSRPT